MLSQTSIMQTHLQPTRVADLPGVIVTDRYVLEPAASGDYDPRQHTLLAAKRAKIVAILDAKVIADAQFESASVLPDCPIALGEAVAARAKELKVALTGLKEAIERNTVLIGGLPGRELSDKLPGLSFAKATPCSKFKSLSFVMGDCLIRIPGPCRNVAIRAAELITAGKPVTPDGADALRLDLLMEMGPKTTETSAEVAQLHCGDLHTHSFYSDGNPSPVALVLQAIHCFMDYAAITDHNTLDGARVAERLLADHRVAFPLTVGEEISMPWSHMCAFPLREFIPPNLSPADVVKAAHAQGAVIQWNHPGFTGSQWEIRQQPRALAGTELDAWEHIPESYDKWKAAGLLPIITGTTDTHSGTFGHLERTIVFAPAPGGAEIVSAFRRKQVVAVTIHGGRFFYSPNDAALGAAWSALADGKMLKQLKARRLQMVLRQANVPGLIRASHPRAVNSQASTNGKL